MSAFRNSTVLVTGAAGLIGSRIIKKLFDFNDNIKIVAFVHSEEKARRVLEEYMFSENLVLLVGDICTSIKCDVKVDYIIHAAGVTGGSKQHVDTPMRTINTALQGTINVLEYAKETGVRGVVYLSSLEVYGKMPQEVKLIDESMSGYVDITNVRSSYSESKRMCECICASYSKQFDVPVVIARLTATFGPGVAYNDNRVFAQFARSIIERKDIVLRTRGDTVRNYCDVDDCADALLTLLNKGEVGQAYNIANRNTEISIKELAETFISLFADSGVRLKFDLAEDIGKLGYNQTNHTVLTTEKIEALGWKPKYSLNDTIERLVHFMDVHRE